MAPTEVSGEITKRTEGTFFGHPRALPNVFMLETWERFSFFGMRAILVLYLHNALTAGGLGLPTSTAISIVGGYVGFVYFSTIIGAWISDRVLGTERTLFYSAALVTVGHVALAVVPGLPGVSIGCGCVALGAGGIKAASAALIGQIYPDGDSRKDAGFAIFYAGITLGAFLGPIVTGLLQSRVGFHWGFGAAAVAMAAGLVYYSSGRRLLPEAARTVLNPIGMRQAVTVAGLVVIALVLVVVALATGFVHAGNLSLALGVLAVVAATAMFTTVFTSRNVTRTERMRVGAFIPIFVANIVSFLVGIESVLVIYTDQMLDRDIGGFEVPIAWILSATAILEAVLAVAFAALWSRGRLKIPIPMLVPLGAGCNALALASLLPFAGAEAKVHSILTLLPYLVFYCFSLFLMTVMGLSVATKLAPKRFYSQLVALFYLSIAIGSTAGGGLAAAVFTVEGAPFYFGLMAVGSLAVAVLLGALTPITARLLHGVR